MTTPPPLSPAESLAALLGCLVQALVARLGGGRASPAVALILDCLKEFTQRFADLAARLRDGTEVACRPAPNRNTSERKHCGLPPQAAAPGAPHRHRRQAPEMAAPILSRPHPKAAPGTAARRAAPSPIPPRSHPNARPARPVPRACGPPRPP